MFNKCDLPAKMDLKKIKKEHKIIPSLAISALKGTNLDRLKEMVFTQFVPAQSERGEIILHLRQKLLFEDIFSCLKRATRMLEEGYSEEIYVEEIRKVIPLVGQLTGEIQDEDVLTRIFDRFCIGK